MAKRRVRELNHRNGNGSKGGPAEETFSSGVTLVIRPFSIGLWQDINIRAFQDYPDPEPPKKTVKVLGGTEEVDDLDDPGYKARKKEVENQRGSLLTEAVLDICPALNLAEWEGVIRRLEKFSTPFPDDPDDRRIEFLTRYVLRTKADYEKLMMSALEQILVDDPEVAERLRYFQRDVERAAASNDDAPGIIEGERLEIP